MFLHLGLNMVRRLCNLRWHDSAEVGALWKDISEFLFIIYAVFNSDSEEVSARTQARFMMWVLNVGASSMADFLDSLLSKCTSILGDGTHAAGKK